MDAHSFSCSTGQKDIVIIENRHFRYEISKDGKNLHFTDKLTGTDYLNKDSVSWCATLTSAEKEYNVTDVSLKGSLLKFEFGDTGTTVGIRVRKQRIMSAIKVESVEWPGR